MVQIKAVKLLDNAPFGRFPGTTTLYPLDKLADARLAEFVSMWVTSTLNQPVTLQVIANDQDDPSSTISPANLGGAVNLASGGTTTQRAAFTVNLQDHHHQFYGLSVTTQATAPTAGRLDVVAYVWQRQVEGLLQEIAEAQRNAGGPGAGGPTPSPPGGSETGGGDGGGGGGPPPVSPSGFMGRRRR